MVPGLSDDAGWLHENAEYAEALVGLDGKTWFDAETLGAIAVKSLDAAFGVAAIAAHVPFAGGAGRAGHRVGPSHNPVDVVTCCETAVARGFDNFAQQFMAEHQPVAAGRRFAVGAGDDFPISAADAQRKRANQNCAVRDRRLGNIVEPRGTRYTRT